MIPRLLLSLALALASLLAVPAASAQGGTRAAYDTNAKTLVGARWQQTTDRYSYDMEEGTVKVQFLIKPDGSPANVRVTPVGTKPLKNTVRLTKEMIEKMRFPAVPPAILKGTNGKGIPSEMVLTVAG